MNFSTFSADKKWNKKWPQGSRMLHLWSNTDFICKNLIHCGWECWDSVNSVLLPSWSLCVYLCTVSQLGAFMLTCAQSPRLEPLCLPVHNLPDCKFDGFIMPKYSHRNWEPYHTHFQMLLICNASVLIAESLSQVCACGCCSCCLPAKGGVGVVLVNWPQFLFYFLNERIPFKILERWW